jgi:protein FrlC
VKNLQFEQFAASNFHYIKHTRNFFMKSISDLGIHLIEFYMACPHFDIFNANFAEIRRLKKELDDREIQVCCSTLEQCNYPINIASEDKILREKSIEILRKTIEYTSILEAPYTQVLGGRGSYDLPKSEAWKRSKESLITLAEVGSKNNVCLVIEEASWFTTNTVYSTPLTRKMLDEVNKPFLKAMLDNCATETANENFRECMVILGEDMKHMHFADGKPGGHFVPGEGNLPLIDYLNILDDFNYKGAITFELYNRKYELDPHYYMKMCFEYISNYLK